MGIILIIIIIIIIIVIIIINNDRCGWATFRSYDGSFCR